MERDSMNEEERLCDCGDCRYCDAYLSSEDDYPDSEYGCSICGGGGCIKCED